VCPSIFAVWQLFLAVRRKRLKGSWRYAIFRYTDVHKRKIYIKGGGSNGEISVSHTLSSYISSMIVKMNGYLCFVPACKNTWKFKLKYAQNCV
jgi:hypothetical protein